MRELDQDFSVSFGNHPSMMPGEQLLWRGKPQRKAFVVSNWLKMLPVAVIWLAVDFQLIAEMIEEGSLFLVAFTMVHLFPVWIWLFSGLTAVKRWKNTDYFLTTKRIVIRSGVWSVNENSIFLRNVTNVSIRRGLLNHPFGTGSVLFNEGYTDYNRNGKKAPAFEHLENPDTVYSRTQQAIEMQL